MCGQLFCVQRTALRVRDAQAKRQEALTCRSTYSVRSCRCLMAAAARALSTCASSCWLFHAPGSMLFIG
jgi:hypothetical protein